MRKRASAITKSKQETDAPRRQKSTGRPIFVGCAGWAVPPNVAREFPAAGSHLERFSQVLSACEINTSFYRQHREQTWARWAAVVPDSFRFAVKAPRAITHEGELICERETLSRFFAEISPLGKKLGPVLFQLPPKQQFEKARVERFLTDLRNVHDGYVVVEPRHRSWFDSEADWLLQTFRVGRVAADPACVASGLRPGGWPGIAYYRLHGSPRTYYSSYEEAYLNALALEMTAQAETRPVWCIFDNTASGAAAGNALSLLAMTRPSQSC
jgi:uncharacterized protein YecE (DUF72 family)